MILLKFFTLAEFAVIFRMKENNLLIEFIQTRLYSEMAVNKFYFSISEHFDFIFLHVFLFKEFLIKKKKKCS